MSEPHPEYPHDAMLPGALQTMHEQDCYSGEKTLTCCHRGRRATCDATRTLRGLNGTCIIDKGAS